MPHFRIRFSRHSKKTIEFILVALCALAFLSPIINSKWIESSFLRDDADHWEYCYVHETSMNRLLGWDRGGWFSGNMFYPLNKNSLLFNEPTWGTSLMLLPIWLLIKNIFFLEIFAGIPFLILASLATYYFAKSCGCHPVSALYAMGAFSLSSATLDLVLGARYFFWPIFMIPLLGICLIKIFSSPSIKMGILFGLGFGFLSWSSAHLTVMGGFLYFILSVWFLTQKRGIKPYLLPLGIAVGIFLLMASFLYIPMILTHHSIGLEREFYASFFYATNWANLFTSDWFRPFHPLQLFAGDWAKPIHDFVRSCAKGETHIDISFVSFVTALIALLGALKSTSLISPAKQNKALSLGLFLLSFWLLGLINIFLLQKIMPGSLIAFRKMFFFYSILSLVFWLYRQKVDKITLSHLFLGISIMTLFLSFGPFYEEPNGSRIPAPTLFLSNFVPGFSGIRGSSRWGIMLALCLSIGTALVLSNIKHKVFRYTAMISVLVFTFLEMSIGLEPIHLKNRPQYYWTCRLVDAYLKQLPYGAVLEMETYPIDALDVSEHIYSSLFHGKPLVTGAASFVPKSHEDRLFNSENVLSSESIEYLRDLGARYWVIHCNERNEWTYEGMKGLLASFRFLKSFDKERILVFEDLDPQIKIFQ